MTDSSKPAKALPLNLENGWLNKLDFVNKISHFSCTPISHRLLPLND